MRPSESNVDFHVFVCTNKKEGKPCCADKGAHELRNELKKRFREHRDLKLKIRINAAGCLDKCASGIAAVLYPEGQWLEDIKIEDIDRLEELILSKARAALPSRLR
jgi:(2Fe-2S) ferredoxin